MGILEATGQLFLRDTNHSISLKPEKHRRITALFDGEIFVPFYHNIDKLKREKCDMTTATTN